VGGGGGGVGGGGGGGVGVGGGGGGVEMTLGMYRPPVTQLIRARNR